MRSIVGRRDGQNIMGDRHECRRTRIITMMTFNRSRPSMTSVTPSFNVLLPFWFMDSGVA